MRAVGCTMQQSLTPESSALVKQSITLARRRGHAQVTPLHVATTMLSSSTSLFRTACVQTHPHYPHQCKALELCFNVAVNRLPASSLILGGSPHHHHHLPSLSNALVAAFKRAQAHQRRGSIETQQQPILAIKIELEQLVISILDDPSVSRVMREAGFSSTQVKTNVEQAIISSENTTKNPNPNPNPNPIEDVTRVVESLASGTKRSIVVVGECLDTAEGVVRGAMNRIEKGEVPKNLLHLQFITLPLSSFRNMGRDEVENKLRELKCLVMSSIKIRGVVLYLGDLKWAAEYMAATCIGEKGRGNYCPVKHVIMEIRSLVCGERYWVLGISTYKTYMKCRAGDPSLEVVLGLHPINIPTVGSLELSLYCESEPQNLCKSRSRDRPSRRPNLLEDGVGNELTCFNDCSIRIENEARCLHKVSSSNQGSVITSNLPSWLQQYKEDYQSPSINHEVSTLHFSFISPSASFSSRDRTNVRYPDPEPNSASSSDAMEMEYISMFKELNAENLKVLCNALEKNVSSHRDIIPGIASTILQCRSGMIRRKERLKTAGKMEDTWLFFQGRDAEGKVKIAKEMANLVFGSHAKLVSIKSSNSSSNRPDHSTKENVGNKRSRSEASNGYLERLFRAIRENPHRVFLVEDVEQVDSYSQTGIKAAIERGRLRSYDGEEVSTSDAIIILSCESFDCGSRACSPQVRQKLEREQVEVQECAKEISSGVANLLDLNIRVADGEDAENCSFSDAGLVESVDRVFFFKLPEDDL